MRSRLMIRLTIAMAIAALLASCGGGGGGGGTSDLRLAAYARSFMGTPLLSHLTFGALAIGLLILYLRRGCRDDIAMAGLLAGALAFSASFFFVSVACDYRYLFPLDLAAMVALFHFFAAPPQRMTKI